MLDAPLQPVLRQITTPLARRLFRSNVSADQITLVGFLVGMLALPALAMQAYGVALGLILINRLSDGLDGAVARLTKPTDRGAFLDIALDFVFYAAIPLGFAVADPSANALAAATLIAAFVGTGSSFLAFSIIAAKRDMPPDAYPAKGFYYLGGLTEGTETIGLFIAICLLPEYFGLIAYGFAAACALTTVSRIWQGWRVFNPIAQ